MPYRSTEVANEFLKPELGDGRLTQMQLQKLAFIANGWNTAINGGPLIYETPQAWDYGPVYPELYDHTKYFGKAPVGRLIRPDDNQAARFFSTGKSESAPYSAVMTPREKSVISHVWKKYGKLDGVSLSRLTHQPGTPWFETFTKKGKNSAISADLIAEHYRQLAARAKPAAA